MLISQDIVRREILYIKDGKNPQAEELLLELALYGKKTLSHCHPRRNIKFGLVPKTI